MVLNVRLYRVTVIFSNNKNRNINLNDNWKNGKKIYTNFMFHITMAMEAECQSSKIKAPTYHVTKEPVSIIPINQNRERESYTYFTNQDLN